CDICDREIQSNCYCILKAKWHLNSVKKYEKYKVKLCKPCFLGTLSYLRNQKKLNHLFEDNFDFTQLDDLGLY
ncbi:hypothetical protein NQ790_18945, partial [Acinetobacter baumannii]|nr:hypothetical protein [Acinetobacter baumannii]